MSKNVIDKRWQDMIDSLIEIGRANNLKALAVGDIEIEFFAPQKPGPDPKVTVHGEAERGPSEDELLFYSTDTFDQMRIDREEHGNNK